MLWKGKKKATRKNLEGKQSLTDSVTEVDNIQKFFSDRARTQEENGKPHRDELITQTAGKPVEQQETCRPLQEQASLRPNVLESILNIKIYPPAMCLLGASGSCMHSAEDALHVQTTLPRPANQTKRTSGHIPIETVKMGAGPCLFLGNVESNSRNTCNSTVR